MQAMREGEVVTSHIVGKEHSQCSLMESKVMFLYIGLGGKLDHSAAASSSNSLSSLT